MILTEDLEDVEREDYDGILLCLRVKWTRDLVMISVCQFDTESPAKIQLSLKIISTRLASGRVCGIFS